MNARRTAERAPAAGAVRTYRVVSAAEVDAIATAAGQLERLGWQPLEVDARMASRGAWITVTLWAIPPGREEAP